MSKRKEPDRPDPEGNIEQDEAAAETVARSGRRSPRPGSDLEQRELAAGNAATATESETGVAEEDAADAGAAAGAGTVPGGESELAEDPAADDSEGSADEPIAGARAEPADEADDKAVAGADTEPAGETGPGAATALVAAAPLEDEDTGANGTASDDAATAVDKLASLDETASASHEAAPDSARPLAARLGGLRVAKLGAWVASLAAAGLAVVALVLWWQFLQGYVNEAANSATADGGVADSPAGDVDATAAGGGEGIEAALRSLDARIAALGEELAASRAELEARVDRAEALLENLPARFAALERRVNAVQGSTREARESLLREEAEYYLTLANTELEIAGRWERAAAALEIADDKLRELANPALRPVREAVSAELIALNSVELPDIEGIVITLGRLLEQAPELPLRPGGPNRFAAPETGLDDAEPGLDRLWLGVQNALRSIVSVERREAPVAPVLTAAEQQLARRQLQLELQLARFAATSGRQEAFSSGVIAARTLLEQDFDAESVAVENAVSLLDELANIDVAPFRPDVSGSLRLLRSLAAEGD